MIHFIKTLVFLVFAASLSSQNPSPSNDFVDGELIVQFQKDIDVNAYFETIASDNFKKSKLRVVKNLFEYLNIHLISFDEKIVNRELIFNELNDLPFVENVSYNYLLEFRDSVPNDPLFDTQWDMELMEAPTVWGVSPGGETINGDEIVVAVLDKGFELDHPDLVNQIWTNPGEVPNNNFDDDNNGEPDDVHGWNFIFSVPNHAVEKHGTNVLGIIGAEGNNDIGLAGVNWNVKLMPLSASNAGHLLSAYDYVFKIRKKYNDNNGSKGSFVVATNLSAGFSMVHCFDNPIWNNAYEVLGAVGVLNTGATDNANYDVDIEGDIPTSCSSEFLISVTSTDINDEKVQSAAYGLESIDLGAPGGGTTTTSTFAQYREDFRGTSSASPHVAGAIALLYSMPCTEIADLALQNPPEAARLVRDAIFEGVDPIPSLNGITATGGRININNAMQFLHGYCIASDERNERDNYAFQDIYLGEESFVRIYPNPVHDILKVDYSSPMFGEIEIQIFNAIGQLLYKELVEVQPFVEQTVIIDEVENWAVGTYFINIVNEERKITEKFIKGTF